MFERYRRGTNVEHTYGEGLGLASVRHLVEFTAARCWWRARSEWGARSRSGYRSLRKADVSIAPPFGCLE